MDTTVATTLDLEDPEAVERRKQALRSSTFAYEGRPLTYHVDGGNKPFDNERAVELAVAKLALDAHDDHATVIEVGNVLSHYFPKTHSVLDKFEHHKAVDWNEDVLEFQPPFAPSLIVSVSTLEHVGHAERPRDPTGFGRAVARLLAWLRPGGELLVTVPLGYNPSVLELLEDPAQPFDEITVMKRVSTENEWIETTLADVREAAYGRPFPGANAIVIAKARKPAAVTGDDLPHYVLHPPVGAGTSGELKEFYDRKYYARMAGGDVHQRKGHLRELPNIWRAAALLLHEQPGAVTDVGAGRGELAQHLIDGGTRVTLLDYAEPAMAIAREYIGDNELATFVVGDAAHLTEYVEPGTQDAVFMTDVVEHISTPELRAIFAEVKRVLAPGGALIVHTPEKYVGSVSSIAAVQGLHINLFQIDTLRDLLTETFNHADVFTWNGVERFANRGKCIELFGVARDRPYEMTSYPELDTTQTTVTRLSAGSPGAWSNVTLVDPIELPSRFVLRLDLETLRCDADAIFHVLLQDADRKVIAWSGLRVPAFRESPADLYLASETFNRVVPGEGWGDVAMVVARTRYTEGDPVELRLSDVRVLHA